MRCEQLRGSVGLEVLNKLFNPYHVITTIVVFNLFFFVDQVTDIENKMCI